MFSQAKSQTQWFFYTCFRRRLMLFFVHASIRGCHDVKRFYGHKKAPFPSMTNTATNTNSLWTLLLYVEAIQMVTARFYSGGKLETRPGFIPWIQIHRYIYEIQNINTQIHPWSTEYKYTDTIMKHRIQIHRYISMQKNKNTDNRFIHKQIWHRQRNPDALTKYTNRWVNWF